MVKKGLAWIGQVEFRRVDGLFQLNKDKITARLELFLSRRKRDYFWAVMITSFCVASLSSVEYLLLAHVIWQGTSPS